jgi:hypothetical protein
MAIFMLFRVLFGLFIIAGAVIGLWNAILTLKRGEPFDNSSPEGGAKP